MKTNIYLVTGDNGELYEEFKTESVIVPAQTKEEAEEEGKRILTNLGFPYDTQARLEFEGVIMKKPKKPAPKCKHCGKANPL